MDLVYILGKGSRWHDNEIRFSLRSAEKYFKFRNVVVIGELPEWMQGVIHIPVEDVFKNKLQNARSKYLKACTDSRVSDNFILMNDDFFFLKEIEEIPYYSRGELNKQIQRHCSHAGYYFESLKRTRDKLIGLGYTDTIFDFEVHAPIIFNKEKLKNVISVVGGLSICLLRTIYGNLQSVEKTITSDFKVGDRKQFYDQIRQKRQFLSISDSMVVCDEFRKWIWDKFPEPSKYEEDLGHGSQTSPGNAVGSMRYYAKCTFSYNNKNYQQGDLILPLEIKEIKLIKRLKDNWEFK